MPTFKVRLEDPETGEARICVLAAESEDAAAEILLAREQKAVDYRLTTEEYDAAQKGEVQNAKAKLLAHEQAAPYEVVSVEDYTGGFWAAAAAARAEKKGG